ncbi:hypothetical protein V8B97DRAFT_105408 [Scleroderma yunnanense]
MTDVPSKLGELMLRGWILTDNPCPAPSCKGVPILRSPRGQGPVLHHCVSCDGNPRELSSNLSSPTFAPPVETEEMSRRRQQSDQASTEIGKRLLKGWAMLGDECPSARCFGIPLVRPPKTNGDKGPRKECVVCGTVYVAEGDSQEWQRLVPISSTGSPHEQSSACLASRGGISDKGSTVARNSPQPLQLPTLDPTPTTNITVGIPSWMAPHLRDNNLVVPAPSNVTLDTSTQALELALGVLSERLTMTCANSSLLDPGSVAETAEAIGKVAQALAHVNCLRQCNGVRSSSVP